MSIIAGKCASLAEIANVSSGYESTDSRTTLRFDRRVRNGSTITSDLPEAPNG